ncbi:MAG: selenium-dependent molybdenum cofactor biosynthesis protein YqeB [Ilumatobacteraceae bacterium]
MANGDRWCVVRGGGDIATGAVWRLRRAGYRVVVTELASPLTIRRTVAVSSAVTESGFSVEGMRAELAASPNDVHHIHERGSVPVIVAPMLADLGTSIDFGTVVDARLAKRPLDTSINDADLVVALGPGFIAGRDCHAVVETNRGHRLGRVIWEGAAEPDTGTPGLIEGRGAERVLRAPIDGVIQWSAGIGERVSGGSTIGRIVQHDLTETIKAPFDGVLRGAILDRSPVRSGTKIADVDPRIDDRAWREISDKALAVGGGVVEAVAARGPM